MKNYDLKEKKLNIKDPVEGYFECISYCDVNMENAYPIVLKF